MNLSGQALNILDAHVKLGGQGHFGRVAHDQMGLNARVLKDLQNPHAIDNARRTADAHNQAPWLLGRVFRREGRRLDLGREAFLALGA